MIKLKCSKCGVGHVAYPTTKNYIICICGEKIELEIANG